MQNPRSHSTFVGRRLLVTGDLKDTLLRTKNYLDQGGQEQVLIFDNVTGKQVDFDFRGSAQEVLDRALPPPAPRGPGRPRIGVVSGEVTLLPAQWEWLARQPGKASGTIRRLIEAARKDDSPGTRARRRTEAAGSFMWSIAGNFEGFEEASRALYAGDWERLAELTARWPADIREHLAWLVRGTVEANPSPESRTSAGQVM